MSNDTRMHSESAKGEDAIVDQNRLFSAMGSRRSRLALAYLHEHDDQLSLADLADEVAVAEHDRSVADVPAEAVKRVHVSLYHNEVPKLRNLGLVAYEQERDLVALSEDGADATSLLIELDLL
ncbi:hypothetical protein HUG10_00465 [Halorarum halophilum]|uniref:DUF7344 domain-containing protein n=1 Tax=Halorarum halophilum TaxID=2743090 RepID=A0A7D5KKE9_9EURY|nr:hypothetical protein [Halobaculum halophilum]QLG26102.1 hypothetical protein HUG10_00465 [Halobaculum halophilum]